MKKPAPIGFKARLQQLSRRQQLAFMAALCERLLPNYALYAQITEHGSARALRAILDLAWEFLSVREARIDFARQAEKLAEQQPPDEDDSFGARRAAEAVTALAALLDALQGEAPEAALEVSRVSRNGVRAFIEMTEGRDDDDEERIAARLRDHPLMDEEHAFQQAALETAEAPMGKDTVKALRRLGRNEGVSNLGLSLS